MRDLKAKLSLVGSLLLTITLFISCLDEADGIVDLNNDQRTKWVNIASGEYFGYVNLETTNKDTETRGVDFEIRKDSTFICKNFPVNILTSYIDQEPYKQILKFSNVQTMTGIIHPYYGGYDQYYSYYFFQDGTALSFNAKYNEVDYKVDINYATSMSTTDSEGNAQQVYPIALKNVLSEIMTANILIKSVTINSVDFPINKAITLEGYPTSRYKKEQAN